MHALRLIGLLATLLAAQPATAAPSDIDTSFGVGGFIFGDVGPVPVPFVSALQPDGKLIVAGTLSQGSPAKTSWLLRRYAADGSSDLSFGPNGAVIVSFGVIFQPGGNVGNDYPFGIALLPDGRVVVAGKSIGACGAGDGCETALIVARFNADGTLDGSFGSGGKLVSLVLPGADAIGLQADGKLLIWRNLSSLFGGLRSPLLERLNVDGSPDSAFMPTLPCVGNGTFRIDQDGRIVVATVPFDPFNPGGAGFCVARLNGDGAPDTTFGTQGVASIGMGASGLADFFIDAGGRIVIAGRTTTAVLMRLESDGSPDAHFGSGGMVAIDALQAITAVTGDCHGRTIVAGAPVNGVGYFLLGRVLQDGSVDATFSAAPGGFAQTNASEADQLFVRPNGRIIAVAVRDVQSPPGSQLSIIQYLGDLPCATTAAVEYYYAAWNYYFETAFPDEIAALDNGAFGGAWKRTGETFNVWPQPNASTSPTCRFFSTAFAPRSSHFYTPFPAECAIVKTNPSWQFESIAFYVQIPTGYGTGNGFCPQGTMALYRAYNNGMGGAPNHRYTTSLTTLNTMLAQGWVFEGEAKSRVFACVPQ